MSAANDDLATRDYWDAVWQDGWLPPLYDLGDGDLDTYPIRRFHELLRNHLPYEPQQLLEVGAGRSAWLPYFAREFSYQVTGIDYSSVGCAEARRLLDQAGVEGAIAEADAFDPPEEMLGRFGIVFSIGVVEHFTDTATTIEAFARFLQPRGTMITVVPNMHGTVGLTQRLVDRAVFETHVQLSPSELAAAHAKVGLTPRWCGYFLSTNFGVVNLHNRPARAPVKLWMGRVSKAVWLVEQRTRPLPATRLFAPYVVCIAAR